MWFFFLLVCNFLLGKLHSPGEPVASSMVARCGSGPCKPSKNREFKGPKFFRTVFVRALSVVCLILLMTRLQLGWFSGGLKRYRVSN
jgi:hypothetical protein